jgi:hypothetical protein
VNPVMRISEILAPSDGTLRELLAPGRFGAQLPGGTADGALDSYWNWLQMCLVQQRVAVSLDWKEDDCGSTLPAFARLCRLEKLFEDWRDLFMHHGTACAAMPKALDRLIANGLIVLEFNTLHDTTTFSVCRLVELAELQDLAITMGHKFGQAAPSRLCRSIDESMLCPTENPTVGGS